MTLQEMNMQEAVAFFVKVTAYREDNKVCPPGTIIRCPVCRKRFTKTHGHRVFCSGAKKGECQYAFWQVKRKIRSYAIRQNKSLQDIMDRFQTKGTRSEDTEEKSKKSVLSN